MNKRAFNIIVALGCAIAIEFIIIICMFFSPRVIIEEKEVPVKIETIKEVPVEVEVIVEKEVEKEVIVEVEVKPKYTYSFTSVERELLARIVYREANIESLECQKAIASVVINRLHSGYWGDTLSEVIYYKDKNGNYQFSPAYLLSETTPTETNYKAVDEVLKHGVTLPSYVMYFRANYHFKYDGYKPYKSIDNTYFGYHEWDKK
jgi:hypothetical protein